MFGIEPALVGPIEVTQIPSEFTHKMDQHLRWSKGDSAFKKQSCKEACSFLFLFSTAFLQMSSSHSLGSPPPCPCPPLLSWRKCRLREAKGYSKSNLLLSFFLFSPNPHLRKNSAGKRGREMRLLKQWTFFPRLPFRHCSGRKGNCNANMSITA